MDPIARLRMDFLSNFKKLLNSDTLDVEDDGTFSSILEVATMFISQQLIADKTEFGKASINRWRKGESLTRNMRLRRLVAQDVADLMKGVKK